MFVSFITFVLVLSVTVSRATGTNNVALKDQLARSLTHVGKMLVDMENKIELERKVLLQFDNELNHSELLLTHPDYDGITDIWWTSNKSTGHVPDSATGIENTASPGKYGNVTITIKTTPSLFPRPSPTTTFATLPSNWHLSTNMESPFVADMKKNMALNHHGYFTAFAERFTELVYTKAEDEAYPVVHHVALLVKQNADNGTFKSLGADLLGGLEGKLAWFESLTPQRVKAQAGVAHITLKVIDESMPDDIKNLIKFYDKMFTKEEGEELFESLEPFYIHPQGNIPVSTIAERIFNASMTPYIKSEGKRKQRRLIQHILMAAHELDPHFRAQTMSLLEISDSNANYSINDHNQPAIPERRSINYKKIIKHFLIKHPKLFRKIKRQYKHDKKSEHHRLSHMRKRHHNYRKSRGENQRRERLYDPEQTRPRAYTESSYEPENDEVETDSSESGAYYRENSKVQQQKHIHKVQRAQQHKIQLKQYTQKQRTQTTKTIYANTKQKQWNLLRETRLTTKPYQDDPEYLKQLAILFLRNKQRKQNFYRNRRLNIPSSQEETCNHSQDFEDSAKNDMLHKIREASSYSDEEDHLRNNLYDVLRHGNRTFAWFRKSGGGINNKHILRPLSSETDQEWVLKNNIYKVFEREKNS